jgi:hypothetical protein
LLSLGGEREAGEENSIPLFDYRIHRLRVFPLSKRKVSSFSLLKRYCAVHFELNGFTRESRAIPSLIDLKLQDANNSSRARNFASIITRVARSIGKAKLDFQEFFPLMKTFLNVSSA